MRSCGRRVLLPGEGLRQTTSRGTARSSEGWKVFPLEGNTDPPDEPAVSVDCGTPEAARQLRSLLEGLGIDPNALEIRIGVRQPGEPGQPRGGDTIDPGAAEAGVGRLTGRLMEALTSLCQAGERFVDSAAEGGQRSRGSVRDPEEECSRGSERIRNWKRRVHAQEEQ
jgi:hypothetical protein